MRLPKGSFNLMFKEVTKSLSLVKSFWLPHLESIKRTLVIGGWRLFFFDPSENRVFRYYDFNVEEGDDELLRDKLREAHPDALPASSTWDELRPQRDFYLAAGDIHAFEIIQKWFFEQNGVLLERKISRELDITKIQELSPILLGRPVSNKFIKIYMKPSMPGKFGFRFGARLGGVAISDVQPEELETLRVSYDVSDEGLLQPGTKWETAFGIVTRFPHPSGRGSVTIIAADFHSLVTSQIAKALTDEDSARLLLAGTDWATKGFPKAFEMLVEVPISPAGMGGEGYPQILLKREITMPGRGGKTQANQGE
jgi:hypothetical protein